MLLDEKLKLTDLSMTLHSYLDECRQKRNEYANELAENEELLKQKKETYSSDKEKKSRAVFSPRDQQSFDLQGEEESIKLLTVKCDNLKDVIKKIDRRIFSFENGVNALDDLLLQDTEAKKAEEKKSDSRPKDALDLFLEGSISREEAEGKTVESTSDENKEEISVNVSSVPSDLSIEDKKKIAHISNGLKQTIDFITFDPLRAKTEITKYSADLDNISKH